MKVYIKATTTESEIAQFIGQPVWVKYACFNDFAYVKINSMDKTIDTLTYEYLPAYKLDTTKIDKSSVSWRITNPHRIRVVNPGFFFENFTMVQPTEILTDDDIQDMLIFGGDL